MNHILPEACWALVVLFFLMYLMLDGFDLAIGMLQGFKTQPTQRTLIQKILPFWNGNEVWLLVSVGALFAFFPQVYATICSALYIPVNLLLFSLIIRAICLATIHESTSSVCSCILALSSFAASFILGTILGNLVFGINPSKHLTNLFRIPILLSGLCLPCLLILYARVVENKKILWILAASMIFLICTVRLPTVIITSPEGTSVPISIRNTIVSNTARLVNICYILIGLPVILTSIAIVHIRLRPPHKRRK